MLKFFKSISILLSLMMLQGITISPLFAQDSDETTRQLLRILWGRDAYGYAQWSYYANIESSEIEGTPYLFGDFTDGVIRLENNQESNVMPMNFNVYDQEIIVEGEEGYLALKGEEIESFKLITRDAVHNYVRGFQATGLDRDEFVRIIVKGEMSFLYKPHISLREAQGSGYGSSTGKEFEFNERYYIHKNGKTDRLRRLNKKHVLRLFDDMRDAMERYAESNELNLGEVEDVAKLVEYYNSVSDSDSGSA
jgi:hypothetical protein